MSNRNKSRVFIGSSSAGLEIARALRDCIGDRAIVTVWNEDKNVGMLGHTLIDSLERSIHKYDFGVFLLRGDDILISKDQVYTAARDNVLFELGMFAGWFGINRTFMVYDNEAKVKIPSDLAGITFASYQQHPNGWRSALSPAADSICEAIERQGALSELTEEKLRATVWNARFAWALFTAQSHLINEMSEQIRLWSARIDKWTKGHFVCEQRHYEDMLKNVYEGATKEIFSTSVPAYKDVWLNRYGNELLEIQKEKKSLDVKSTRVFLFDTPNQVKSDYMPIFDTHKKHGVDALIYIKSKSGLPFSKDILYNDFSMVDFGKAIGITQDLFKTRKSLVFESHWYFDDQDIMNRYRTVRALLLKDSMTVPYFLNWSRTRKTRVKA